MMYGTVVLRDATEVAVWTLILKVKDLLFFGFLNGGHVKTKFAGLRATGTH